MSLLIGSTGAKAPYVNQITSRAVYFRGAEEFQLFVLTRFLEVNRTNPLGAGGDVIGEHGRVVADA
ncbi:hypothetical protein ACVIGA_006033 [Bradyrhizobium sp. USDA 3240]